MPRRAPDKVVEHRMSLTTQSSKLMRDAIDAQKKASLLKGVGSVGNSLGTVAIAGGIGLAAYAFFSWSGAILPSIREKGKEWSGDIGNWFMESTDTGQDYKNSYERILKRQQTLKENTAAAIEAYDAIIEDPNSSDNQVAAATAAKQKTITKAKRVNAEYIKLMKGYVRG